mgnify:CR=1 FL=1
MIAGAPRQLLIGVSMQIPVQRYALLSQDPTLHRALIDLLAGLRPPTVGRVWRTGVCSWPIGRSGFVRGRLSGWQAVRMVARLYGLDEDLCRWTVAETLSQPELFDTRLDLWPPSARQELVCLVPLLPQFDIYIADGPLPVRRDRYTTLWRALFAERVKGRMLVLSTSRLGEVSEHCDVALVLEGGVLRIETNLDDALLRYPLRLAPVEERRTVEGDDDAEFG